MDILYNIFDISGSQYIYSKIDYIKFICGSISITKNINGAIYVNMTENLAFIQLIFGLIYRGKNFTIIDNNNNPSKIIKKNSTVFLNKGLDLDPSINQILIDKYKLSTKQKPYISKNFTIKIINKDKTYYLKSNDIQKNLESLNFRDLNIFSFNDKFNLETTLCLFIYALVNKISLNFGTYIENSANFINHYNYPCYKDKKNIYPIIHNNYVKYINYYGDILTYCDYKIKLLNTKNDDMEICKTISTNQSSVFMKLFESESYIIDVIDIVDIDETMNHLSKYSFCYCNYINGKFIKNNNNILIYINNGDFNEKNVMKYLLDKDNTYSLRILKFLDSDKTVLIYNPNIWGTIKDIFYNNNKPIYNIKHIDKPLIYEFIGFLGWIVKLLYKSVINKLKKKDKYTVNKKQIKINDVTYNNTIIDKIITIIFKNYCKNFIILNNNFISNYIIDNDEFYVSKINNLKNNIFMSLLKMFKTNVFDDSIIGVYIMNNKNFNSLLNKNKYYKIIIIINILDNELEIQFYYKSNDDIFNNLYNDIIDYANNI